MYTEAVETSQNAVGTLQNQQDTYMESTAAHLQQLSTEAEKTYDILFDTDTVNNFTDALTGVLSIFNNLIGSFGSGTSVFTFFGATLANILNKQIGGAIEKQIENFEGFRANVSGVDLKSQVAESHAAEGDILGEAALEKEVEYAEKISKIQKVLTKDEYNDLTNKQKKIGLLKQQLEDMNTYKKYAKENLNIENATVTEMSLANDEAKKTVKATEEIGNTLEQYNKQGLDIFSDDPEERQKYLDDLAKMNILENEQETMGEAIAAINNGEELSAEQRQVLENVINRTLEEQKNKQQEINNELEKAVMAEEKEAEVERQLNALEAKTTEELTKKERQQAVSALVQGATSLVTL
jgi:hypothetical protein